MSLFSSAMEMVRRMAGRRSFPENRYRLQNGSILRAFSYETRDLGLRDLEEIPVHWDGTYVRSGHLMWDLEQLCQEIDGHHWEVVRPVYLPGVWKTLDFGTHATVSALVHAVEENGGKVTSCELNMGGKQLLAKTQCARKPFKLEIVRVRAHELGFTNMAEHLNWRMLFARAAQFGLYPCPQETGLQLCRQYPHDLRLDGGDLLIAMKPIKVDHASCVYSVGYNMFAYANMVSAENIRLNGPPLCWQGSWVFALRPRSS